MPKNTRVLLPIAACLIVLATWLARPGAQATSGQWTGGLVQNTAPPGIDRGVVDAVTTLHGASRVRRDGSAHDRSLPYVPGRVLVKFRSGGTPEARAAVARLPGAHGFTRPEYVDFDVLEIDPALNPEAVAALVRRNDEVEYAQASYRSHPLYRPNDPLYADRQWNLQAIGMEQAWDINQGANNSVVVAVLDTGVAYKNAIFQRFAFSWRDDNGVFYPALGPVTLTFAVAPELAPVDRFVSPWDFIWRNDSPLDMDGHGTHVAGVIGEGTNNSVGVAGMAFNVRIMPVKVISTDWDDIFDSPAVGTDLVLAQGIRYAADNGAKVINMSIGFSADAPALPSLGDAMRYAVSKGAFITVSSGNSYDEGNPIERLAEQAGPIAGAMVVAAVGRDLNHAYYSGARDYVEITAPGGDFKSGGSGGLIYQQTYSPSFVETFDLPPSRYVAPRFDIFDFIGYQGTSFSAPHVAGLAALLYSQGINNPAAIEAAIKRFAIDKGAKGRDDMYGEGLINPRATLRGLGLLK